MSNSEKDSARARVDLRVEPDKVSQFNVGSKWKVVASSPGSLWEGAHTVTLERIETESGER